MSGDAGLERGYRRLLACYPRRFRDEHGEELLGVLLAGAPDGQHRPGLLESADLVWTGLGMRLRPDVSRSARQGWSDALAGYSLAAPVLLLLITVTSVLLQLSLRSHHRAMTLVWPGFCATLAIEAVIIALVMAGRRKTALAALPVALLWLGAGWIPGIALFRGLNQWIGLSVCLLEASALIASPGPRPGRRLMHWGHWAILPVAAAAPACLYMALRLGLGSLEALGILVILILAVNRLGRALRLSRYFRLLLAATFYPTIFLAATSYLAGLAWMIGLGYTLLPLASAGPLLCAAVALSTVIRPRRRRII
jgi:hypothetical protein